MSDVRLTPEQREAAKAALLRALRVRYPGRAITVEWNKPDADSPASGQPSRRTDESDS